MAFTSFEGDMSKEDEDRLLEELANAREEIKSIKMRQAMVRRASNRRPVPQLEWTSRLIRVTAATRFGRSLLEP